MPEGIGVFRLIHFAAFMFMAAPLFMLIIVNERAVFGRALDPKMDRYKEPARAQELAPQIWGLRRQKRLSSLCLFLVLTALILGLRLIFPYSLVLTLVFVALAGVFAWRVYSSLLRYGWI